MVGVLLDTNVVSEGMKPKPNPLVLAFLVETRDHWLSVVTLHELEYGVKILPPGNRREGIAVTVGNIASRYRDRILPVDRDIAERAAELRARARALGRVLESPDSIIAATAAAEDLCLATRNVSDFDGLDLDLVNPWEDVALPRTRIHAGLPPSGLPPGS